VDKLAPDRTKCNNLTGTSGVRIDFKISAKNRSLSKILLYCGSSAGPEREPRRFIGLHKVTAMPQSATAPNADPVVDASHSVTHSLSNEPQVFVPSPELHFLSSKTFGSPINRRRRRRIRSKLRKQTPTNRQEKEF
jgi:hypothetical protein